MLCPVAFAGRAVKALVSPLVDIALRVDAAENFLNNLYVALLRRADEIVIGDIEALPEVLKACNDVVYILDRRNSCFLCLLLNLLSVLVTSCEEKHVITCEALETGNRVRNGRAVSMTDMKLGARIINRRRYVKVLFFHWFTPPNRTIEWKRCKNCQIVL